MSEEKRPGLLRYNPRRDANESAIIDALLWSGATVEKLNIKGAPDLLVGYNEKNYLIEVKNGKAKLNKNQKEWHEDWHGKAYVVRTPEEAIMILEL